MIELHIMTSSLYMIAIILLVFRRFVMLVLGSAKLIVLEYFEYRTIVFIEY